MELRVLINLQNLLVSEMVNFSLNGKMLLVLTEIIQAIDKEIDRKREEQGTVDMVKCERDES